MPITLYIRGPDGDRREIPVSVDIPAELERFEWTNLRYERGYLVAASPFRFERHPSFAVSLETGGWNDAGADDDAWQSGGLVKLLAFLENVTLAEVVERLIAQYGERAEDAEPTLRMPRLTTEPRRIVTLNARILDDYRWRHPYLGGRGISEDVQRLMSVGYDRERKAVTLPWFNADGTLANVKYRRVDSKVFWYAKGGRPIREIVYGLHIAYKRRIRRAAIVEGETDALTLMSAGVFAVATGGANAWSTAKRDAIIRSPIEEIILFRDNDDAGKAWAKRVISELSPYMCVKVAAVPGRYKDVNEAALAGVNVAAVRERRIYTKIKIA